MIQPPTQKVAQPILTSVAAHLFVRSIHASCEFFQTRLGFTVDFVYGDPPFYGQVTRDNARLALRFVEETFFAGDIREREDLLSASITVASAEEIKQLFLTYQAAGVPFHQSLIKQPWARRRLLSEIPTGT